MKYYFIYVYAFPLGLAMSGAFLLSVALNAIMNRRPVVLPSSFFYGFWITFLIPVFLLSINHIWVSQPLSVPCLLLNIAGSMVLPAFLLGAVLRRKMITVVGKELHTVKKDITSLIPVTAGPSKWSYKLADGATKLVVFSLPYIAITYVCVSGPGAEAGEQTVMTNLSAQYSSKPATMNHVAWSFLLCLGLTFCVVGYEVWCFAEQCRVS